VADATNNQLWFIIAGAATILTGLVAFFVPDVRAMGLGMDEEQPEPECSSTAAEFSPVQQTEID
jgi:hypothetical protein